MVSHSVTDPERQPGRRGAHAGQAQGNNGKGLSSKSSRDGEEQKIAQELAGLKNYQLGDCLGKGAFGSVYRALNWGTGETVAVKQVRLADLPKTELRVIMLEIDLLKNLNHPNIVKYHGFEKTAESLYIILEYCENGSLHSICKNFGKFPENLVALYMSQVLHGLLYLHEQGVIHRDIKGANILTTKEGLVKLADFGVATRATGLDEASVVGTPYWMAPEVIELSGATTASDIWSLGCTVIELLDGKPPYHKLQPMPALFRIVNDDHPPFPEGTSTAVRDFLMQCFQKDPNLRVSAKKLLKHPWIVNARRADAVIPIRPTKYDEAVKSVQEWNEAIKSPKNGSFRLPSLAQPAMGAELRESLQPANNSSSAAISSKSPLSTVAHVRNTEVFQTPEAETDDNWDADFASAINPSALQLPHLRPHDNFAGLLSAEKLKAFANNDVLHEEHHAESVFDAELTVKSPIQLTQSNPLETVRHIAPGKGSSNTKHRGPSAKAPLKARPQLIPQVTQPRPKGAVTPKTGRQPASRPSVFREDSFEDYSDLVAADDTAFAKKVQGMKSQDEDSFSPRLFHPSDLKSVPKSTQSRKSSKSKRESPPPQANTAAVKRPPSTVQIQKYAESMDDEDFSDIFGPSETALPRPDSDSGSEYSTLMLSSKFSLTSWVSSEEEEYDPFAQLEKDFKEIENLISSLKNSEADDDLVDLSDQLMQVLLESPDLKSVIISSHGMLPILEILEIGPPAEVVLRLLKIVNMIILENQEIQENLCFVGGIPIVSQFAHKKYPSEIRLEAAAFVRQMYQTSTLTLQMFISCGGLNVLVDFLEEDIDTERDLVLIGVNGVWSVFELQGPTPKNDFCRIFSRSAILYPLSLVLNKVLDEKGELSELIAGRIVNIFLLFSQAENHVKELVADRMVLKRVLKDLQRMSFGHQITMLKFIKNLSMLASTHDSLQNSNAIEVLTDLLSSSMKLHQFREISNQVLNIMYNLCRLSKTRQEDAALNGIIPLLQHIVQTEWPLKEFALPILCDMAHSGKVGRKILWQNKGLHFYISLLADKYWQVNALDAILKWLQEETAKVEQHLVEGPFSAAMVECFTNPEISADAFEKTVDLLQQLLHLSPPVAACLVQPGIFARTAQKLHTKNPRVRKDLLHVIRCICYASDDQGTLIRKYGLYDSLQDLADMDPGILVRQMASGLVKLCDASVQQSLEHPRRRNLRRSSSSSVTSPAPLISSQSMPPTPQRSRASQSRPFYENGLASSRSRSSITPSFRPTSRDGNSSQSNGMSSSGWTSNLSPKSRVPRPSAARLARMSLATTGRKEENTTPTHSPSQPALPRPTSALNPRRRRQTSSGAEAGRFGHG